MAKWEQERYGIEYLRLTPWIDGSIHWNNGFVGRFMSISSPWTVCDVGIGKGSGRGVCAIGIEQGIDSVGAEMTNEEFVRANWQWVQVRLAEPFEGIAKGKWTARLPLLPFSQCAFDTEAEAWAAAAEFTRDWLEQVRQLEAEIKEVSNRVIGEDEIREWVDSPWGGCAPNCGVKEAIRRHVRSSRTLARLEAVLADLKRGMR